MNIESSEGEKWFVSLIEGKNYLKIGEFEFFLERIYTGCTSYYSLKNKENQMEVARMYRVLTSIYTGESFKEGKINHEILSNGFISNIDLVKFFNPYITESEGSIAVIVKPFF